LTNKGFYALGGRIAYHLAGLVCDHKNKRTESNVITKVLQAFDM